MYRTSSTQAQRNIDAICAEWDQFVRSLRLENNTTTATSPAHPTPAALPRPGPPPSSPASHTRPRRVLRPLPPQSAPTPSASPAPTPDVTFAPLTGPSLLLPATPDASTRLAPRVQQVESQHAMLAQLLHDNLQLRQQLQQRMNPDGSERRSPSPTPALPTSSDGARDPGLPVPPRSQAAGAPPVGAFADLTAAITEIGRAHV